MGTKAATKDRRVAAIYCQECGMRCEPPDQYHPYLFCELRKLGHTDPAAYLAQALPSALLLLPSRAGQNVADHFQIVKRPDA